MFCLVQLINEFSYIYKDYSPNSIMTKILLYNWTIKGVSFFEKNFQSFFYALLFWWYVRWGDSVKTVDTKKLEEHDIPYKMEYNKVNIPEDAFEDAIYCSS
jgi:hypothetical protein